MKKIIASILILGMVSSISCASFAVNPIPESQIIYNSKNCSWQNLFSWYMAQKRESFMPIAQNAQELMKKNTGLERTFDSTINIFEDDSSSANFIKAMCGGGAYSPTEDLILLTEKTTKDVNTVAHEMTHAELCNRLKTCKKYAKFPYKHSISFEEGITSQNNPNLYDKESIRKLSHEMVESNLKNNKFFSLFIKFPTHDQIDKNIDKFYSDEYKPKLIFAPVTKGGGASYLVHNELVSEWKKEKGPNVIADMINAVNEGNILPEEYFLQNGGEKIVLSKYGEEGLKTAKRNIRSLKVRSFAQYAITPLSILLIDRSIRSGVNLAKLIRQLFFTLKSRITEKNSTHAKTVNEKSNNDINELNVNAEKVFADGNLEIQNNNELKENFKDTENVSEKTVLNKDKKSNIEEIQNNDTIEKDTERVTEILDKDIKNLDDLNLENDSNSIEKNKNNLKELSKKAGKYWLQTVLLSTISILLTLYCQQQI